jgi:hypothetical protein
MHDKRLAGRIRRIEAFAKGAFGWTELDAPTLQIGIPSLAPEPKKLLLNSLGARLPLSDRSVRLLPGVEPTLDVAGKRNTRFVGGLNRHG